MTNITISVDEDVRKVIDKRAKKNMLTLKEQIEEIVRESAVRTKGGTATTDKDIDDTLVSVFSRKKK